jgi:hypothetical protein
MYLLTKTHTHTHPIQTLITLVCFFIVTFSLTYYLLIVNLNTKFYTPNSSDNISEYNWTFDHLRIIFSSHVPL